MKDLIWQVKTYPNQQDELLALEMNLSASTVALLRERGYQDKEELRVFFNPTLEDLPDPFLFKSMNIAVNRLVLARERQEKITIYGDYDADGVSATAVMIKGLERLGFQNVNSYIPNRFDEGYGLNPEALTEIINQNTQVLISVDCGISALAEGKMLKEAGVEWILTDHHQPGDELPEAFAIINPHVLKETYPFQYLAGVGVAFEMIRALSQRMNQSGNLNELLPLVAIGTIGDVVPMRNINRILTKLGIEAINQGRSLGIRALADYAGLGKITSATEIAFQIVPKLNASGRMAHADSALRALLSEKEQANDWAKILEDLNKTRKKTEQVIQESALQQWKQMSEDEQKSPAFIFYDADWHAGVLGIVAARLSDMLQVPVFVCSKENELIKGSGRAPQGYHLFQLLTELSDSLLRFGGHAQAAGISFEMDRLDEIRRRLREETEKSQREQLPNNIVEADLELGFETDLVQYQQELAQLEPFGSEQEEPLVLLRGVQILSSKTMSQGQHLQIQFQFGSRRYAGIGWRIGEHLSEFQGMMDLLVKLQISLFRGVESFRVEIVEWRETRLFGNELLKKIRSFSDGGQFVFHSPESRALLAESGLNIDNLPLNQISSEFPFLPLSCVGLHCSEQAVYLLDPPMQEFANCVNLFDQNQVQEWKQTLFWLLPDRRHLASWYRWLKNVDFSDANQRHYKENPGNLSEFLAKIAVKNAIVLFREAGLILETNEGFEFIDTQGSKVNMEQISEFQQLQKKREQLLQQ